jgi:NAD(P)-dependent dehydrogenase (short-subunit alcohol dehydrogenase family)
MREQQMALSGKVAIVAGAAQGIGIPVARRFLQDGFSVVVADNNDERGAAAVTELSSRGEVRGISTELLNELTSVDPRREAIPPLSNHQISADELVSACGNPRIGFLDRVTHLNEGRHP